MGNEELHTSCLCESVTNSEWQTLKNTILVLLGHPLEPKHGERTLNCLQTIQNPSQSIPKKDNAVLACVSDW